MSAFEYTLAAKVLRLLCLGENLISLTLLPTTQLNKKSNFKSLNVLKMINSLEQFELNKLRTQIAYAIVLEKENFRQPEVIGSLSCPFCQSQLVYQRMCRKDGDTHFCRQCQRNFSLELVDGCRCWFPGKLAKCHDCSRFQAMLPLLKEANDGLRNLSRQELKSLLSHLYKH